MQNSWDAVLLGAVTLIATLNGALADQKVAAVAPQTTIAVARSDAAQTQIALAPAPVRQIQRR